MAEKSEPKPTYSDQGFTEYIKWRSSYTGVPEDIITKVRLTQLDQFSRAKNGQDGIQYWVDKGNKEANPIPIDSDFFTWAFRRDIHYPREKAPPIRLPQMYQDNVPFSYDGGYILLDDDANVHIMMAAMPNEKADSFGDRHDHAKTRIENRTGIKLSEFAAAQRCYVVHTYNKVSEKVEILIVPIVSFNKEKTTLFLGNSALLDWPNTWESTRIADADGNSTDVTNEYINPNSKTTNSKKISEAEERYSKVLAKEWMFNSPDLSVKFVTGEVISEWANSENFAEQTRGKLREELLKELADPTIERDEAYRNYMRKVMQYGSQKSRELVE
jgi:hypothetical protein